MQATGRSRPIEEVGAWAGGAPHEERQRRLSPCSARRGCPWDWRCPAATSLPRFFSGPPRKEGLDGLVFQNRDLGRLGLGALPPCRGHRRHPVASRQRNRCRARFRGLLGASALVHGLKRLFARPRPDVPSFWWPCPRIFPSPAPTPPRPWPSPLPAPWPPAGMLPPPQDAGLGTLIITAALVGISRVYLQVHYVSDVVAGAMLGVAWVLALNWLLECSAPRL